MAVGGREEGDRMEELPSFTATVCGPDPEVVDWGGTMAGRLMFERAALRTAGSMGSVIGARSGECFLVSELPEKRIECRIRHIFMEESECGLCLREGVLWRGGTEFQRDAVREARLRKLV